MNQHNKKKQKKNIVEVHIYIHQDPFVLADTQPNSPTRPREYDPFYPNRTVSFKL